MHCFFYIIPLVIFFHFFGKQQYQGTKYVFGIMIFARKFKVFFYLSSVFAICDVFSEGHFFNPFHATGLFLSP